MLQEESYRDDLFDKNDVDEMIKISKMVFLYPIYERY